MTHTMNWDPRDKLLIQNTAEVFVMKAYAIGTFQNDRVPAVLFCWLYFFPQPVSLTGQ